MTFDNLIALHEMLWPDTNLNQQIKKWEEEYKEFENTVGGTEDEMFEIADMVIVSAGIARFDYCLGIDSLHDTISALDTTEWSVRGLWQAVETKMRKNMKREWVKKADVGYHHENGIED